MISGDTASLLFPGLLTVLLYALALFVVVATRRRTLGPRDPRPLRGPFVAARPVRPRPRPRLRVIAGGARPRQA